MKWYNHVLKAGRGSQKRPRCRLRKRVYDTYSKSHDMKTFEKLLVDHNVDPKIIAELTKQAEKTGPADAGNGPPSATSTTTGGPKSSSNGARTDGAGWCNQLSTTTSKKTIKFKCTEAIAKCINNPSKKRPRNRSTQHSTEPS